MYGALDLAGGSGGIRLLSKCLGSDPKPSPPKELKHFLLPILLSGVFLFVY